MGSAPPLGFEAATTSHPTSQAGSERDSAPDTARAQTPYPSDTHTHTHPFGREPTHSLTTPGCEGKSRRLPTPLRPPKERAAPSNSLAALRSTPPFIPRANSPPFFPKFHPLGRTAAACRARLLARPPLHAPPPLPPAPVPAPARPQRRACPRHRLPCALSAAAFPHHRSPTVSPTRTPLCARVIPLSAWSSSRSPLGPPSPSLRLVTPSPPPPALRPLPGDGQELYRRHAAHGVYAGTFSEPSP